MLAKVRLKDVIFHGFHGLHPEEKRTGNTFTINLEVQFPLDEPKDLSKGVDYVELFEITKSIMESPQDLLESVGADILTSVKIKFPFIVSSSISITKSKPPIPHFQGNTEIELNMTY